MSNCSYCGDPSGVQLPDNRQRSINCVCSKCLKTEWPRFLYATPAADKDRERFLVPGERTNGVEIEINIGPRKSGLLMSAPCEIHEDGSLRGDYPLEIVSPILSQSTVSTWLKEIEPVIKGEMIYKRTGLHVWVGTSGWMTMQNLLHFGRAYQGFLRSLVAQSRWPTDAYQPSGAPMALPAIPYFPDKKSMIEWLYGPNVTREHLLARRINDQRNRLDGARISRYWWMNCHPIWKKKAIEIRLHQGTTNITKIEMWIRMWNQIVQSCESGLRGWSEIVSPDVYRYYATRACELHGIQEAVFFRQEKEYRRAIDSKRTFYQKQEKIQKTMEIKVGRSLYKFPCRASLRIHIFPLKARGRGKVVRIKVISKEREAWRIANSVFPVRWTDASERFHKSFCVTNGSAPLSEVANIIGNRFRGGDRLYLLNNDGRGIMIIPNLLYISKVGKEKAKPINDPDMARRTVAEVVFGMVFTEEQIATYSHTRRDGLTVTFEMRSRDRMALSLSNQFSLNAAAEAMRMSEVGVIHRAAFVNGAVFHRLGAFERRVTRIPLEPAIGDATITGGPFTWTLAPAPAEEIPMPETEPEEEQEEQEENEEDAW